MANLMSPLEALSYVQQQGEIGRERGQRNQLAQLYSQTYTAAPEQQNALLGQMAAINPQAAQATQQQFQGQEDRRLQKLAGAARYLEQARQTNNPQAVQGAWNAVRPMLQREMPQGQFPDQWDDATMAPTLYQVLAQTGGGAQGNVQSVRVGEDGYYYNVMRDGRVVNTGIKSSPNIKVLEQEGQVPIGVVTSGGVAGQTVPIGGGQAAQQQPQGAYIDPSLPPEVQAQIRQSLANGQEPPAQMVFGGQPGSGGLARTPTSAEKAAAEAQAKIDAENRNFPNQLAQTAAIEGIKTRGALDQARGEAQIKNEASRATVQQQNAVAGNVWKTARDNLKTALGGTATGPFVGRLPAVTTGQQIADGAVSQMAPVLKQIFRQAGEGTFTDKDQDLLIAMLPTRTDTPASAAAKIDAVDLMVQAKLQAPPSLAPAQESPAQPAQGAPTIRRYNPATGRLE